MLVGCHNGVMASHDGVSPDGSRARRSTMVAALEPERFQPHESSEDLFQGIRAWCGGGCLSHFEPISQPRNSDYT